MLTHHPHCQTWRCPLMLGWDLKISAQSFFTNVEYNTHWTNHNSAWSLCLKHNFAETHRSMLTSLTSKTRQPMSGLLWHWLLFWRRDSDLADNRFIPSEELQKHLKSPKWSWCTSGDVPSLLCPKACCSSVVVIGWLSAYRWLATDYMVTWLPGVGAQAPYSNGPCRMWWTTLPSTT